MTNRFERPVTDHERMTGFEMRLLLAWNSENEERFDFLRVQYNAYYQS